MTGFILRRPSAYSASLAGIAGDRETRGIIAAILHASQQLGPLRLTVFGRHAEVRERVLSEALKDQAVELECDRPARGHDTTQKICRSRCSFIPQRNNFVAARSAIAGIACGLTRDALQGSETAPPITTAGCSSCPKTWAKKHCKPQIGQALVRILSQNDYACN